MGEERPHRFDIASFQHVPRCREDAARAIRLLGPIGETEVNAGALLYIGEAYDWPAWLIDGTRFAPGRPIPPKIRIEDELIAIANLYDHVDPFEFTVQIMRLPLAGVSAMAAVGFQVAPSLGAALALRAEMHSRATPHIQIAYERGDRDGRVRIESPCLNGRLRDSYAVGLLGLFYILGEAMCPQLARGARLEIALDGPRRGLLAGEVRCPVRFGAAENRLVIAQSVLDAPNPRFDPAMWKIVQRDFPRVPSRMVESPTRLLLDRIRHHLDQHRVPRLKQIADELRMSERTIVRLLHAENTSFRLLVDDERRSRAVALLADPALELAAIAERLGFVDRPSFWRTFRRWFGVTPAQYRRD